MSQQGERRTSDDDWWTRLYDEPAPDSAPATAGDTLDDRFKSVARAVSPPVPDPRSPQDGSEPCASRVPERPAARDAHDPAGPAPDPAEPAPAPNGPPPRAPWQPPGGTAPPGSRRTAGWWEPADSLPPLAPPPPGYEPAVPPPPPGPTAGESPGEPPPPPPPDPPAAEAPAGPPPPPPPDPPASETPAGPPPPPPDPPAAEAAAGPPLAPPDPPAPAPVAAPPEAPPQPTAPPAPRVRVGHVGDRPPTYDAEPTALPAARPDGLGELVADTVLDGARYGAYVLRAASVRGDSARYRGEPRRDALLTARFGNGEDALVLVAIASGTRTFEGAHLAAADACRWIGGAIGRSHARLAADIRAGRRGDLKSGLHRLTDRSYGRLRARAAELGAEPEEYTAGLRCLLLSADPGCRTRVFFGVGPGGLFRLRGGVWQDIEPAAPEPGEISGAPVVGFGSPPSETAEGDRLTMDLHTVEPARPYIDPPPPPAEPFRFRASVARPGDTLLLCGGGLAEPLRGEPALAKELAERWTGQEPPGLAAFLADVQLRVKGYADDRTAVAVWEA
ncbi:protein phosphatase 2C domain-containing protein [Streptomyces sp. NPDC051597]|uniref:protein phosphatase 2C domain-containing protein n=1 Tax=Streptomyces sp. NPDC051597 TaxID=3155049 RepID=UPI0034434E42